MARTPYSAVLRFVSVVLLLLLLIFDQTMAMIYLFISLAIFLWHRYDKGGIAYPPEKAGNNRPKSFMIAIVALGVFTLIATLISKQMGATMSIFDLLATSTPVLQGNKFLTIIGWGILIPIIETVFFNGVMQEWAMRKMNTSPYKFNSKSIMVIMGIAVLFALFHLTSKQLSLIPLTVTFMFSIASGALVIWRRQIYEAITLHILVNILAVLSSMGVIFI